MLIVDDDDNINDDGYDGYFIFDSWISQFNILVWEEQSLNEYYCKWNLKLFLWFLFGSKKFYFVLDFLNNFIRNNLKNELYNMFNKRH